MEKLDTKSIENILSLTPLQEGMLFHYLKDPRSGIYFEQLSLEIYGAIDDQVLERAWNNVIENNEMLRTVFRWEKLEKPSQVILKKHACEIRFHDFSDMDESQWKVTLTEIKSNDRNEGFDLLQVPFRVTLCKLTETQYEMIISNYHILYDGWSNGIILKELFNAYYALSKGEHALPLPDSNTKPSFKEYVKWLQGQDKNKQEQYWRDYLAGFETATVLPIKRKKEKINEPNDYSIILGENIQSKLDIFLKNNRVTLASIFYSAWGILLQKYCGCEDILFGTTVSGRSAHLKGIEDMVGLFINTIPLRINTYPGETIIDVVSQTDQLLREREEFEHTPLVDIGGRCELLFDTILVMENYPLDDFVHGTPNLSRENNLISIQSYSLKETTHYDLTVGIMPVKGIEIKFSFKQELFENEAIENLAGHFKTIIQKIIEQPETALSQLEIIAIDEKNRILYEFNNTAMEYPRDKTIHQLFLEQVEKTPDSVGLVGNVDHVRPVGPVGITYRQLNEQSDRLAGLLIEKGVLPDMIVGIMMERSIDLVIGIYGILKSGGAYLPIDPEYPIDRINYMLKDSNAKILIINKSEIRNSKSETNPNVQNLNDQNQKQNSGAITVLNFENLNLNSIKGGPRSGLQNSAFDIPRIQYSEPHHLIYVIYTSGSTGKPKGVMVKQEGYLNLLYWYNTEFQVNQDDNVLLITPMNFDLSQKHLFSLYMVGGRLTLPSPGIPDYHVMSQVIRDQRITIINCVPSVFNPLIEFNRDNGFTWLKSLRIVILGGEAMQGDKLLPWVDSPSYRCEIMSTYGPTEGTDITSLYRIPREDFYLQKVIPIGKPIFNVKVYILDKYLQVLPLRIPGELCIGGISLAKGYHNNIELTQEKFFAAPHLPEKKVYRTGDIARWLADGNIEFIIRIDQQVKIRGMRVELGEIENKLLKHEKIKEVVVMSRQYQTGDNYLCAYIVPNNEFSIPELREYLAKELPDYMIPAYFMTLEKIPLTPNGKINRKALPEPQIKSNTLYTAPQTDIEKQVARIWQELLNLEAVSIHDNFFEVGGNSLSVMRLVSKLNKIFNLTLPVVTVFKYPTILSLSHYLARGEESPGSFSPITKQEELNTGGTYFEIAVIGMAGRFPGAKNIAEFWENLKNGVESITFFSRQELIQMNVESGLIDNPNHVPAKGILQNLEYFDAPFFGYTPSDAEMMDPQVRIFHECVWEALEDGGYNPGNDNRLIGLYAGATFNPFWLLGPLLSGSESLSQMWQYQQLADKDYLCARTAYKLNLKGPVVSIQTACSTSLVAVDAACQALMSRKCEMALAGGVSVTLHDKAGYLYQEGMVMSQDGHCRAFDAGANGTVGGNGVGAVLLKPLAEAIKEGDHIYATIRGSAVNNDGADRVGFTAPSVKGQAEVIRAALYRAGFAPESIGYIETHGTGTTLGDPIELQALKEVFVTGKKGFCAIGSVKTNLGHLDAAAGIAGFIKTVLALKHKCIPPTINFEIPNPQVDFINAPFYINNRLTVWENGNYPLRAGVSSFGIGGSNAHVVLEEWPAQSLAGTGSAVHDTDSQSRDGIPPSYPARKFQLILLSAKTPTALDKMTENFSEYLNTHPGINLADTAYTLQVGRKHFEYRRMLVCQSPESIAASSFQSFGPTTGNPRLIFMLPGLGAQYVNMGGELYETEPLFRSEMDRCFEIVKPLTGLDIKKILYPGDPEKINRFEIAQLVIFIFEYALAGLLMKWGIIPDAMIGYSFGELAVACLAGVFSLEDALKLIVRRGELIRETPEGAMLSVPLPREEILPLLHLNSHLSLAIDNGASCIVSGSLEAVETFEWQMKQKKAICMRLQGKHALHSQLMEPVSGKFAAAAATVKRNRPLIPYISNVSGNWITDEEAVNPGYWSVHLKQTIKFSDGVAKLLNDSSSIFLEVGPGGDLNALIGRRLDRLENKSSHRVLRSVRPPYHNTPDFYYLLRQVGRLWLYGKEIDWQKFYPGEKRLKVPLPTYPFESESRRHWIEVAPFNRLPVTGPAAPPTTRIKKIKNIAAWFYVPSWELVPLPPPLKRQIFQRDSIIVFMDTCGLGEQLVKRPEMKNYRVIKVYASREYKKTGADVYEINAGLEDNYTRLMKDLYEETIIPGTVIHLWGVTIHPGADKELEKDFIAGTLAMGFYSLVYLVKAKNNNIHSEDLDIYVVSNHIHEIVGEEQISPVKAAVLGPCCVIPQEFPNIKCMIMDIGYPGSGILQAEQILDRVLSEMAAGTRDTVIAFRGKQRWVRAFKPVRLEENSHETPYLRERGVYLLTGGLGDHGSLGFIMAGYLARHAGAKIILVSRTPLPTKEKWPQLLKEHDDSAENHFNVCRKIKQIMELERLGAEVLPLHADISDPVKLKQAVDIGEEHFGKINGVIHLAGILGEQLLRLVINDADKYQCEQQFIPKIHGLVNLYRLFENRDIDFCFLYSSLSSIMGPCAAYSAGNNFMDAFINKAARERSQRWIAVNWDRWQRLEDGPEDETELSMTSDEGLEALHRILSWANARQVLVSTGDLKARLENLAPIKASAVESLFRRKPDMADWFYIQSWKKSALPIGQDKNDGNKGGGKQGSWLVFTNETPMAIRLIEKLQQQGIEGVTVVMGPEFARLGEGKYTINPQIPGNYDTLFKELVEAGAIPVNILHLWCATGDDHPGCELEELEKIQDLGLYSLLYIAQSIGKQNMGAAVQIGVVSTCLQPVTGKELLRPARATLLGPIKIIPVEYSNIDCCSIDISPLALKKPEHERMADELIREFEANFSQSRVVAYRENQRYVQDYEPVRINKQNGSARLKQRGIYLITGGLGGIGFTLAQYLATNFKARLILTDISGFPLTEANVKKIKEMEKQGAEVLVEQADVAIFEQMEKVILGAEKRFGKIDGVIQAAGLIDYAGVIQKRTRQMTQNVLAAKVKGTLVLEQLLQKCSLDFLVLFSSIGNMMPRLKFGQVGYNAGHEFMDIFAYYKQAQGTFTVTIDWNDWLEVGMSVEADRRSEAKSSAARRFAEATSITPSEGLRAFNLVLGCNYPQVAICPSDLKQMIAYMFSSKYEDLDFFALPGTLRERPQMDAEYIAPGGPIEEKLVEIFQKLFGFERIGVKDDFFQLGGDSLKAMTAIAHIHKRLNTQIPLVEFFKRPYVMGLAEYIRQIKQEACISIEPVEKKEYYELSPAQKRMYIVYRMDSDNTSYNSSKILPLADKVEKDRLELTFKKLIQRHESLRTSFHMLNDTLIQKIHQDVAFEVEYHDLAGVGTAEETVSNSQSAATTVRNFIRPFDLSRAPLLRVGLVKTTDLNYILMVDMHHIISDGVTVNIVISDYNSLHSGKSLPPLRLQYKDYVEWQNREHREESLKKQEAYWLGQFQGGVSTLCLPYDYERPAVYRADGAALRFTLPPDTGTALKQLALDTGTTLFMVLLAIYNVLLGKISGQEAIVIGTALTGRRHIDLEHIVGMFVNMLALPNYPRPDKSFTSFLSEVKNSTLEALDNQDYQFEDLVDRLALKRDSSRHPLFDVAFSYMEVEKKVEEIPGNGKFELDFNLNEMVNITSKYDLTLILLAATDQLSFSLEYCTKLFKEKKIKRFISYFKNIVNLIVEKPGIKISEIEIISDEEEKRLLKNLRMKQGDAYPGDLQEAVKLPDSQEAEFDF